MCIASINPTLGYQSGGRVDPNAAANVRNAKAAGIQYVDVYLVRSTFVATNFKFPCVPCGNPRGQVQALVNGLRGVPYGMIWIDVERYQWSGSLAANQAFISDMLSEIRNQGQHPGVYTNYYNWQAIVGLGWTGASSVPLWYAHYGMLPLFAFLTTQTEAPTSVTSLLSVDGASLPSNNMLETRLCALLVLILTGILKKGLSVLMLLY